MLCLLSQSTQAGHSNVCENHRSVLASMRAKRKRKDSEEENDYQPEVRALIGSQTRDSVL